MTALLVSTLKNNKAAKKNQKEGFQKFHRTNILDYRNSFFFLGFIV